MTKFFAVTMPAMLVITLAGWASADSGASSDVVLAPEAITGRAPVCEVVESECDWRPLDSGREGELVRVCESVRVTCRVGVGS